LVKEIGIFAPMTSNGDLIVEGVLASCYVLRDDARLVQQGYFQVCLRHLSRFTP
jgi:hypothetical protein